MTWTVVLHRLVRDEDLPSIPKGDLRSILKAVRAKLGTDPESYGKPLRKELFGYWKLRVGDYRLIYRVEKGAVTVLVVKIGARKDNEVYDDMIRRARKLAGY